VATQRSFIMIGVVLLGVLFDRPALTMRTLTIAALVVLLFAPESVVHPSFQMSFAATLALIAGYERGAIKLRGRADSLLSARAALWGVNEIVGLTIASLLAGLATTPYAQRSTSTASRPVASLPISPPCRSSRPGSCRWGFSASFDGTEAALRWNFKQIAGTPKRTNGTLGPKLDPRAYCRAPFDIAAMTSAAESSALRVRLA
jgi:hypothetical protein